MNTPAGQVARCLDASAKVAQLAQTRTRLAIEHFGGRASKACERAVAELPANAPTALNLWTDGVSYAVDAAQRSILYWDTLRQRGNSFVEHERQGLPPVLHFDYEMVMDGRTLPRAVNYALLRIVPPQGVKLDPKRRPYIIIDPRGGHGPGIGGFKDDSQVGVALRAGHPVYFVIFFRDPEPGQTLLDVCSVEREFVRRVRALHPGAPKPAIVGNCQAGWAAMMLAAADPDDTGPVVIVGAPMSYWGGAWSEGEGDNPMRYAGGLLGGSWLASLASDLGGGKFDGAWLVQNFENLNPANTFWNKYYNLYANIDTEPARFLEFERWWGGYYLLNREEIEWITQNLFVGNKLWSGTVKGPRGVLDLRQIKAPIVLFASMGDNITPPQQAFNWVADVYGSTEEIKARGQVIVGLLHEHVGHLGIFVSGQVARKEHAQIVSVLESIEALPPGLYGMQIEERAPAANAPNYEVSFVELRLEDVVARLNRFKRADERPFEAVNAVSELNQRAYELVARPHVQALSCEALAWLSRAFHPLRWQRWACSDYYNPALWWLAPAAQAVKASRQALGAEHPARRIESVASELVSASLDFYRALRDAVGEAAFFQFYGVLAAYRLDDQRVAEPAAQPADPRELPLVKEVLASIDKGGYAQAFARVIVLLTHSATPRSLAEVRLAQELLETHRALLPDLPREELRRLAGEQEIIARYEPARAVDTLPALLAARADVVRLLTAIERVTADERVQRMLSTPAKATLLRRIRSVLAAVADGPPAAGARSAGRSPPARVTRRKSVAAAGAVAT